LQKIFEIDREIFKIGKIFEIDHEIFKIGKIFEILLCEGLSRQ
jgi:hypothetical protein